MVSLTALFFLGGRKSLTTERYPKHLEPGGAATAASAARSQSAELRAESQSHGLRAGLAERPRKDLRLNLGHVCLLFFFLERFIEKTKRV